MQTTSALHISHFKNSTDSLSSRVIKKSNRFIFREEHNRSDEDMHEQSAVTRIPSSISIKTGLTSARFDIHKEIVGRVPELVAALQIDPVCLTKHIRCPFNGHEDRHPSFRIDAVKGRFYCSCTNRGGSIVDLVMRLHGHDDARTAIGWIRVRLNSVIAPVSSDRRVDNFKMDGTKAIRTLTGLKAKQSILQADFNAVLAQCTPANASTNSLHPYARRKSILPIGALHDPKTNRLVLRIHDVFGNTRGLQFIDAAGEKRFARGSKLSGNGLLLGEYRPDTQLGLCEGWATGVAVHSRLGIPVIVAFSANNLVAAACAFSALCYPMVVFGENDSHGEGQRQAQKAADKVAGKLWLPPDDFLGDFNDYASPFRKQPSLMPYLSSLA